MVDLMFSNRHNSPFLITRLSDSYLGSSRSSALFFLISLQTYKYIWSYLMPFHYTLFINYLNILVESLYRHTLLIVVNCTVIVN